MATAKHKARAPVQKRGIETREKILRAGRELFTEKGYHKTNALEIAARAGLGTGTFYSYFNNKKEVLMEIVRGFYRETTDRVFASAASIPGEAPVSSRGLRALISRMIKTLGDAHTFRPELHREFLAMALLDDEIAAITRREEEQVVRYLAALLARYRDHLRIDDIEAAAELLFRTGEEIVHRVKVLGSNSDGARLLKEMEEMMFRYLAQDDSDGE
jgi:AcrR family transcriptional regulator